MVPRPKLFSEEITEIAYNQEKLPLVQVWFLRSSETTHSRRLVPKQSFCFNKDVTGTKATTTKICSTFESRWRWFCSSETKHNKKQGQDQCDWPMISFGARQDYHVVMSVVKCKHAHFMVCSHLTTWHGTSACQQQHGIFVAGPDNMQQGRQS